MKTKPSGITLLHILGGLCIVFVAAAVLMPYMSFDGRHNPATHCLSNVKQSGLACIMYAYDYDDRMPVADRWADMTSRYRMMDNVLHDPVLGKEEYGYAFRSHASSIAISNVNKPMKFILIFDSTVSGRNAQSELWSLPYPGRHSGSNNGVFLDGHAKSRIGTPAERTQR